MIDIDVDQGRLSLITGERRRVLRGKAVELICLMIVRDDWVMPDAVHSLPAWQGMTRGSVGKQVARLIDTWDAEELHLVEWRQKTNGWRLSSDVRSAAIPRVRMAASNLLTNRRAAASRRFHGVSVGEMSVWALNMADATMAMTAGQADEGYKSLRKAYSATNNLDLLAISNVLATRIGQRLETPHAVVPTEIGSQLSLFELAIEARRAASQAIRSESGEWEGQLQLLKRILPKLGEIGELSSQAYVYNALALLLRRLGRHQEALDHAKEAIPLAIFSGDLTLIQSVAFNLGNIIAEVRREEPEAAKGADPVALVETDLTIRRRFGLGMDSAQAELLLAYLALEQGDLDRATNYIADAEAIILVNRVPADRALFYRISGLLAIAKGDGTDLQTGLSHLQTAIGLFDQIGNKASADHVRGELQRAVEKWTSGTAPRVSSSAR